MSLSDYLYVVGADTDDVGAILDWYYGERALAEDRYAVAVTDADTDAALRDIRAARDEAERVLRALRNPQTEAESHVGG